MTPFICSTDEWRFYISRGEKSYDQDHRPRQPEGRRRENHNHGQLGIDLTMLGNKVLLVDADAQGNLTDSLGFHEPDNLPISLATVLTKSIAGGTNYSEEGILHHTEGVDLMPGTIELSPLEVSLFRAGKRYCAAISTP